MSNRVAGLVALSVVAFLVGCDRAVVASAPDASAAPSPLATSTDPAALVASIDAQPAFAGRLGRGLSLVRDDAGFRASGLHPARAVLPRLASGASILEVPGDRAMRVYSLGSLDVPGVVVEGAVVYRDALPDTDVVESLTADGMEEIRILRSARAPSVARYRLEVGAALGRVTAAGPRVVVGDRDGQPMFETAPMFAIDAGGVRRDVAVRIERQADGFVVVASLDTSGLTYPISVDPQWRTAATTTARTHHAAALLGGKVIAAGGLDATSTRLSTAIAFDGSTVASAGSLSSARRSLTLSPLGTTRLLAAGGNGSAGAVSTAELFDGSTWTAAPSMSAARFGHSAVVLGTGAVLVAGGSGGTTLASAEQFNGTSWSPAGTLNVARSLHAAVAFKAASADRVLVVGGSDDVGNPLSSAEVWNGSTWTTVAPMSVGRATCAAVLLADGRVLVTGGQGVGNTYLDSGEVYDPTANTWTAVANKMANARASHAAALASGDPKHRALVAGGYTTATTTSASADFFDPAINQFVAAPTMAAARGRFTLTAMTASADELMRIAAIGGFGGGASYPTAIELLAPKVDGASCVAAADCAASYCTGGLCCSATSCATGYACAGGVCATSCSSIGPSPSCAVGFYCTAAAAGTCVPLEANGASCAGDHQCSSTHCVDGVCCNSACAGECEACNAAGNCSAVTGAPIGGRPACSGSISDPTCGNRCNGVDRTACHYPAMTAACGVASCSTGVETRPGTCSGAGACTTSTKACGAYRVEPPRASSLAQSMAIAPADITVMSAPAAASPTSVSAPSA